MTDLKRIEEWTDAEIISAVRNGSAALIPRNSGQEATIGQLSLDDWEGFEGETGLFVALTEAECRFVAPQMFRESGLFSAVPPVEGE